MQFFISQTYRKRSRNILKLTLAAFCIGSLLILSAMYGVIPNQIFAISVALQILGGSLTFYFLRRKFLYWDDAVITMSEQALIIWKPDMELELPFSAISKMQVLCYRGKASATLLEFDSPPRKLIIPILENQMQFSELLKTKFEKTEIQTIETPPAQGSRRWITLGLIGALWLAVGLRLAMAVLLLSSRPELHLSLRSLVLPSITLISIANFFMITILRRKKLAQAALLILGIWMLVSNLMALKYSRGFISPPYEMLFWAHFATVLIAVALTTYLLVAPEPPDQFSRSEK